MLPWWADSGSRLREAMARVRVATWEWDLITGELLLDDPAFDVVLQAAGLAREEWDNRIETWMQRVHPDDLEGVLAAIEKAITDHAVYAVEYRVRSLDGRISWVELRGYTTYAPDGTPLRMTGTGWDSTTTRMTEQVVTRVLRHLPEGFLILDPGDWRVLYANPQAELLGFESAELTGRIPWAALPGPEEQELRERFEAAMLSDLPSMTDLRVGDSWRRLRLVASDPYLVVHVVDVTAEVNAESDAAERAERITALTEALAQAVTTQNVVDAVAAQILPPFDAGGLLVHVLRAGRPSLVGAVGYPNALVDSLREDSTSVLFSEPSPRFIDSVAEFLRRYPDLTDLALSGPGQAWALLPLSAGGRRLGSCLFTFDDAQAFHSHADTLLASSALVAQALERARMYDEEHVRARHLQQHLLPSALPELPAVGSAARYRPAGGRSEVGGDWYDTVPLSGERVALVVGDVMGHGLREAVTMSRLRTAVSTLTTLDYPPDEMLAHLNDVTSELDGDHYITCLYAVYDSTTGMCTLASAGHPPPAVVPVDGQAYFIETPVGPPLGTAQIPYQTVEFALPPGSLLALYTDGLIGVADSDPESGMRALADRLTDAAEAECLKTWSPVVDEVGRLGAVCDSVIEALPQATHHLADDAAIMVVRAHRLAAENVASWELPFEAASAGVARRLASEQLGLWGLGDLAMVTELIVSELIGNTVRHASGPISLRLIRSGVLTCEVHDHGQSSPRIRHAALMDESGRGLQLVASMAHRWGTRYTGPDGKILWAEQRMGGPL